MFSRIKIFALILLLGSVGCSPEKNQVLDDAATFKVDGQVKGVSTARTSGLKWAIPLQKDYSFTVCLLDRARDQKVRSHDFRVDTGIEVFDVTTDRNGCFSWNETLTFDYFADSKYIKLERKIIARDGVHRGTKLVRIGVNPWVSYRALKEPEVLDLDLNNIATSKVITEAEHKRKAKVALNQIDVHDNASETELLMKDVKIMLSEDSFKAVAASKEADELANGSVPYDIIMEMSPFIAFKNAEGQVERVAIAGVGANNGVFNVRAHLLVSKVNGTNNAVLLNPYSPRITAELDKAYGVIRVRIPTVITQRVAKGELTLALEVSPRDFPGRIKPFSALYVLGRHDEFRGQKSPILDPKSRESNFDLATLLKSASNYEELRRARLAMHLDRYDFEPMGIRMINTQPGETATTRSIEFAVNTCVTDALTGARVQHQRFRVDFFRYDKEMPQKPAESKVLTSDFRGCIYFTDEVKHKYYRPEVLHFPRVRLTHLDSGFSKELKMVINPWDDAITFGFDSRLLSEEYIHNIVNREKIASELFIEKFNYQTMSFGYEVDEFMELMVKKMVLLSLEPWATRYSSILKGRNAKEHIRDGVYLLKVAVEKKYFDPANRNLLKKEKNGKKATKDIRYDEHIKRREFVTVVKKLVKIINGLVITPVELHLTDLRLFRIRTNFLVQLETIDEENLIKKVLERDAGDIWRKDTEGKLKEVEALRKFDRDLRAGKAQANKRLELDGDAATRLLYQELERYHRDQLTVLDKDGVRKPVELPKYEDTFLNIFYSGAPKEDVVVTALGQPTKAEIYRKAAKLNDFKYYPAITKEDPDRFIDRNSGLDRRTFVGPVTLLLNGNGSSMRPTDVIESVDCKSSDCNYLEQARDKDGDPNKSNPFYGSTEHLKNVHVDDLIHGNPQLRVKGLAQLELENFQEVKINSQIFNFLDFYNLNFISLGDEVLRKYNSGCREANPLACLQPTFDRVLLKQQFLGFVNDPVAAHFVNYGPMTIDDLRDFIENKTMNVRVQQAMCTYFTSMYYQPSRVAITARPYNNVNGFQECMAQSSGDQRRVFNVENRMRVYKTGQYRFLGGKSMNINIGVSFNVTYSESVAWGKSFNFTQILGEIPGIGAIFKGANYRLAFDKAQGRGEQIGVQEQALLVMQVTNLDVEIKEHEKCVIVKMNPQFLSSPVKNTAFSPIVSTSSLDNSEKNLRAMRGLMICSGHRSKEPIVMKERFYYFTQHFTEGDQQDQGDILNHPWLLAIRGIRDMSAFMGLIKSNQYNMWKVEHLVTKDGWPLAKMIETYLKVLPTFPGLYTLTDDNDFFGKSEDYPWLDVDNYDRRDNTLGLPQ